MKATSVGGVSLVYTQVFAYTRYVHTRRLPNIYSIHILYARARARDVYVRWPPVTATAAAADGDEMKFGRPK